MFIKGKNLCDSCTNYSYYKGCTGGHYDEVREIEVVIACDEYKKDETIEEDEEED